MYLYLWPERLSELLQRSQNSSQLSIFGIVNIVLPINNVRMKEAHTFLCFALSFPSLPKTQQVLYNLSPERSGIEPPTTVICRLRESSDSIIVEGDASPPASISSAYTGKLAFEYGLFHISWHGVDTTRISVEVSFSNLIKITIYWKEKW